MKVYQLPYYSEAASTGIAGTLHLMIAGDVVGFSMNLAVFFIMAGVGQLFYLVPIIRRWGRPWYYIGIMGTTVLSSYGLDHYAKWVF